MTPRDRTRAIDLARTDLALWQRTLASSLAATSLREGDGARAQYRALALRAQAKLDELTIMQPTQTELTS